MKFTSSEKKKYDIVQNVSWTIEKDGKQTDFSQKISEGWQTDDNGNQMGFDKHVIAGPDFSLREADKQLTVTGVFQLGLGTVTGTLQTERYVSVNSTKENPNPSVKFLGDKPLLTYKVVLTIDKDGSYAFKDESIGLDFAVTKDGKVTFNGKLTKEQQEKLIYTVIPN